MNRFIATITVASSLAGNTRRAAGPPLCARRNPKAARRLSRDLGCRSNPHGTLFTRHRQLAAQFTDAVLWPPTARAMSTRPDHPCQLLEGFFPGRGSGAGQGRHRALATVSMMSSSMPPPRSQSTDRAQGAAGGLLLTERFRDVFYNSARSIAIDMYEPADRVRRPLIPMSVTSTVNARTFCPDAQPSATAVDQKGRDPRHQSPCREAGIVSVAVCFSIPTAMVRTRRKSRKIFAKEAPDIYSSLSSVPSRPLECANICAALEPWRNQRATPCRSEGSYLFRR